MASKTGGGGVEQADRRAGKDLRTSPTPSFLSSSREICLILFSWGPLFSLPPRCCSAVSVGKGMTDFTPFNLWKPPAMPVNNKEPYVPITHGNAHRLE